MACDRSDPGSIPTDGHFMKQISLSAPKALIEVLRSGGVILEVARIVAHMFLPVVSAPLRRFAASTVEFEDGILNVQGSVRFTRSPMLLPLTDLWSRGNRIGL